ncbi:MAG TPA: iron ABC transporter substrate-binding protein [Chloroflexota bacterium]
MKTRWVGFSLMLAGLALLVAACLTPSSAEELTIYSSRTQSLVQPLLEQFARDTGIDIKVRYDTTASIVATVLEEGANSPADVVYLAESSGLAALSKAGLLAPLPDDAINAVDQRFRSPKGEWVGTSGRAKTIVYNVDTIDPERDLPDSVMDFTDPKWRGRIGWAPTHGEWQLLVTGIRLVKGDEEARRWLEGIKANEPKVYPNLISIVHAVANGEVDVGFVNHYYVPRLMKERGPDFKARNHFLGHGDPGALVDVAGVGVLQASQRKRSAEEFVRYLLSKPAQEYFAQQTFEYPLSAGVEPVGDLPPLETLDPPQIDPDQLADLEGTLQLLRTTGVLP